MASAAEMPRPSDEVVNIPDIPEETHLFFDDDIDNVESVRASIRTYNEGHPPSDQIFLEAIYCPPGNLSLINSAGKHVKVRDLTHYNRLKTSEANATVMSEKLKTHIRETPINTKPEKRICSKGLTVEMIQQIIDFETSAKRSSLRKYFFDFDGLLSQVQGFTFFRKVTDTEAEIPGFANYFFSDHIGVEPPTGTGRLAKLREMFGLIGAERAYIITNNDIARLSKSDPIPDRPNLCAIIGQIIPSFDSTHLKKTLADDKKNPNKGLNILSILRPKPASGSASASAGGPAGGMKRSKSRKTYRNRKSLSRARKMRSHKHNIAVHNKRRHSKKSKK